MPQYRAVRAKYPFLEMCKRPELIVEVTLLPIQTFHFDAAIVFSDILLILECFNLGLHFDDGIGPIIDNPLKAALDIDNLRLKDLEQTLSPVLKGISLLREELKVPLIGFCGAPFTVASYMIEGKTSRDLRKTKHWMIKDPKSFHVLLDKLSQATIEYLHLQIKAGAQAIQLFDSWAHVMAPNQFKEFSLQYLQNIIKALEPTGVPIIVFCRGSSLFAPLIAEIRPAAISLDWQGEISSIRKTIPQTIALQGNLDPDVLFGSESFIRQEVKKMLESMKNDPAYIFNLGHGITPETSMDAVKVLVDAVQSNGIR